MKNYGHSHEITQSTAIDIDSSSFCCGINMDPKQQAAAASQHLLSISLTQSHKFSS